MFFATNTRDRARLSKGTWIWICPRFCFAWMATPDTSALSWPSIASDTPEISLMLLAAFWPMRSRPVGIWFGWIFAGAADPRLYSNTRPVWAPRSWRSSDVIPFKEPVSTTQPLLAVVFTICSSCEEILFNCSWGERRLRTIPNGLPRLKYGK